MRRRLADLARAIGATLLLGALLGGVPAALVRTVGWPLPTTVPTADAIGDALGRQGIDDRVVLKTLAVVLWLAWAQFAAALAVEFVALVRGRQAGRAPSLAAVQRFAGQLVATAALFTTAVFGPRTGSYELRAQPVSAVVAAPPRTTFLPPPPRVAPPAATAPSQAGEDAPLYTVKRHDSFWSIAEDTLGDGYRWKEIRQLNVGRRMPDGQVIHATTETIHAGWTLRLPTGAKAPQPTEATAPPVAPSGAGAVVVERGDSFWSIARDELTAHLGRHPTSAELDRYWRDLVERNRLRLAHPRDPNRLYTGQHLELPPHPAPAFANPPAAAPDQASPSPPAAATSPATAAPPAAAAPLATAAPPVTPAAAVNGGPSVTAAPPAAVGPPATASPPIEDYDPDVGAAPPAPTTPTAQAPSTSAPPPTAQPQGPPAAPTRPVVTGGPRVADEPLTEIDDSFSAVTGIFGAAGLALAVGIAAEVLRRRRRRLTNLPRGATPPPPPEQLDDVRAELLLAADDDAIASIQAGIAALTAALRRDHPAARPLLVQASPTRIEALLTTPALPAAPLWTAEASGAVWTSDCAFPPAEGAPPLSTLVTIGAPEEPGQLYLDLEAARLLSIHGAADAVAAFARALALELTLSPLTDNVRLVVVGQVQGLAVPETAVQAAWCDVADELLAHAEQSADLVAANRWTSPFQGRGGRADDNLTPVVVLLVEPPTGDAGFDRLRALLASGRTTVTIVALGDLPGAMRIELDGDALRIPSINLDCRAQALTADGVEQIEDLLADAEAPPPELPLEAPAPVPASSRFECVPEPPEPDVLVRFLGDIDIVGGNRPLTPKQTAVLAYIALHSPATIERIEDAVWTATASTSRKRLANTISECRTALGTTHLPLATDAQYRIGPGVATDLDLFDHWTKYAASRPDDEAVQHLKRAVDLVRGPVFTYRTTDRASYVWIDLENWSTTWELRVIETCLRLAEMATDLDEHDTAVRSATIGLQAVPTHTGLTEALMRAYWHRGDLSAAHRVYQSHVAALENLDLDDVADTTIDLRDRIAKEARPAS